MKRLKMPSIELYNTHGLSADTKRALRMVIVAAMFGNAFTIITTSAAWTGFQRALGADSMQMGILSAIPVAASVIQIFASFVLEKHMNRRTLLLVFGLLHRVGWLMIGLTPLFLPEAMGGARLYVVMVLLAAASLGAAFLNVSYYSLVGDVVPMRIRGSYFSVRQTFLTVTGILAGLAVGLIVDSAEGMRGYIVALAAAGVCGCLDILSYLFMKWPPMQPREKTGEGFLRMLREVLSNGAFMRVVGYFTLWFFAVNIMGPFLNVFLLEEIRMSYAEVAIYNQIVPNVATILIIGWWGRQMDRFGNQPVVQTVGIYCMILPLTYLFLGPRSFWLLPLANVLNGMCFPASDLGQQNMYLAAAPAKNRSMYVAVFFASTQLLGQAFSNFVGGALMEGPLVRLEALNLTMGGLRFDRYDYIFVLSAVLRCICVLGLLPHLRAQRETSAWQMTHTLTLEAREALKRRRIAAKARRLRRKFNR